MLRSGWGFLSNKLYLISQPGSIISYLELSRAAYSLFRKSFLEPGYYLSFSSSVLALFGWFGFLLLLYNLYTDTGVSDFKSSIAWLIISGITNIPLLAIVAYYLLWKGSEKMLTNIHHSRYQSTFVIEREIERVEKEVESVEGKIREYLGYLAKLKQIRERGEVTDEVYQDLKMTYIKELERYKIELNELKNKMTRLAEKEKHRLER